MLPTAPPYHQKHVNAIPNINKTETEMKAGGKSIQHHQYLAP